MPPDEQHLDLRSPMICAYYLMDRGVMLTTSIPSIINKRNTYVAYHVLTLIVETDLTMVERGLCLPDRQHLNLRGPMFCTSVLRDRWVMLTMSIMFN